LSLQLLYTLQTYLYTVLIRRYLPSDLQFLCNSQKEKEHGLDLSIADPDLHRPERAADIRHRKTAEAIMTGFYILGGIVALGLLVYLVIALLKPELFS
jgi:K+-transporting ATPase KdpF subunit